MTFRMLAVIILSKLVGNVLADASYIKYPNVNAFTDEFNKKGAHHLEHCEKQRTMTECQNLCDMDCECHCIVVYMNTDEDYGSGARPCFLRRECEAPFDGTNGTFDATDAAFDTYVKNDAADCSVYVDFGFKNKCSGGTDEKIVTNVNSLQQCKAICTLLSFECTGIEYRSNCADTTQDQCKIFTGGEVAKGGAANTVGDPVVVQTDHCLKYNGTVGNLTEHLMVPLYATINGVDTSLITSNQAAIGTQIKTIVASQHASLNASDMVVALQNTGSVNVTAEIEILLHDATHFYEVRQALITNEATIKSTIISQLDTIDNMTDIGAGPFTITDMIFNHTNAEFRTTTSTAPPSNDTTNGETTSPVTVDGTHQLRVLGTMFTWILAAQHILF